MSTTLSLFNSQLKNTMYDSGMVSLSSRLSLSDDSFKSVAHFESDDSPASIMIPCTSISFNCPEIGFCSDLMSRLSISTRDELQDLSAGRDSWLEFFEPDDDGDVQLHLAIASGYSKVVDRLIRNIPNPELLNIQNNQMYAPLHIAVLRNLPDIVRHLVSAGARLDVQDCEGNTPLHLAAKRGYVECGEALLETTMVCQETFQKSQPSGNFYIQTSEISAGLVNLPNYNGECCVHLAAMGSHIAFLRLLRCNNANMNVREGRAGRTALHLAVGLRSLPTIQCLLKPQPHGCGVQLHLPDWYGRTPLQISIINSMNEVTYYLASLSGMNLNYFQNDNTINSDFEVEL